MTRPRKPITLATKVAVLQSQARCGCGCGESLKGQAIQWDHSLAHALEGSDGPENIRAVLESCHGRITNGTKATTAGSTKHVVAKSKRLAKLRLSAPSPDDIEYVANIQKAKDSYDPDHKVGPPKRNITQRANHVWPKRKLQSRTLRGREA